MAGLIKSGETQGTLDVLDNADESTLRQKKKQKSPLQTGKGDPQGTVLGSVGFQLQWGWGRL